MWLKRLNKKHILFIVFSLFYLILSLVTYKDYGITSDEQLEYRAGKTYFNYLFSNTSKRQEIVTKVSPRENPQDFPYFRLYPGLVSLINYQSYYEWAHLIDLLFGYLGFLVIYLLVFDITRSKLSILAPLLLFLNPYYFGHIPANPKDIPFSTLYLFCVYLIIKLDTNRIKPFIILGIFLGLLTGMRFVGLTLFCFLAIKLLTSVKNRNDLFKIALRFTATVLILSIILYLIWPYLWHDPVNQLLSLARDAQDFSFWDRDTLFGGQLITKDTRPWYYLFTYIFYKTPPLILLGLLGSLFVKSRKILFILVIVVFNLVLYLILQPTIYNEMRHFLYLVPLFTVLSAILFINLLGSRKTLVFRTILVVILCGLLKMSYDFVLLHPYQYVYFNEFAGKMVYITKKYEVDYWSASYKESSEYLRNLSLQSPTPIKVYPCNLAFGVDYYSHKSFVLVNKSKDADYIICDYQNALINNFDLEGRIVFKVVRKGATLSYVAKTDR
ncbi:MAG: glycosyltransferase family 39 protein [Patescibacteria group bacterium]